MIEIKQIDRENIQYFIYNLENFEKDKAIRSGLRSAANVFRVKGRAKLRSRILRHGKQTNHLMNSFTNRVKRNKLGVLSGFARPGGNHAHLVDSGTKAKRGANRGIMPTNHFWSDAKVSEKNKAMDSLYKGVQRAVQRINNRN